MNDFPKMLYKLGSELVWEGRKLATKIVADAEAEAAAVEDGWLAIADFLKGKGKAK